MRASETGVSSDGVEYTLVNIDSGLRVAGHVRVAADSASRRQGLLGLDSLGSDTGLWIAPCEAIHTFGMKMAIDVLFLDRHLKVKKMLEGMPRRRISVCLTAASVVELSAGAIAQSKTKVGDHLSAYETAQNDVSDREPIDLAWACRLH